MRIAKHRISLSAMLIAVLATMVMVWAPPAAHATTGGGALAVGKQGGSASVESAYDTSCALLQFDGTKNVLFRCKSDGTRIDVRWTNNKSWHPSPEFANVKKLYISPNVAEVGGFFEQYVSDKGMQGSRRNSYIGETLTALESVVFLEPSKSQTTKIGTYAFRGLIHLSSVNGFERTKITEIGLAAFEGCSNLASIKTPSKLTDIGNSAFKKCLSLSNLSLNSGLSTIGASAFEGCSSLPSVTLNSGLKSVGSSAFRNCTALKSVEIPSTVETIATDSFRGCSNLSLVQCLGGNPAKTNITFLANTSIANDKGKIKVPVKKVSAYASAAGWKDFKSCIDGYPKMANTMKVRVATKTTSASKLKKARQTVKAITTSKARGATTFAKVKKGSSAKLAVNKKTGKITVKKGTKKGVYKIRVKVTAKGNASYKALSKTVTVKVKVK